LILRRITEHVKTQNWFAVALDFLIVVVGVFIGIQVSNWNAARSDEKTAQEYVFRIQDDLNADFREIDLVPNAARERMSVIKLVLERAEKDPPPASFYLHECVYQPCTGEVIFEAVEGFSVEQPFAANDVLANLREFDPVRHTYDALISMGDIGLLRDEYLTRKTQDYYANATEAQNLDRAIYDNFQHLNETRHELGISVAGVSLDDLIEAAKASPKIHRRVAKPLGLLRLSNQSDE